MMTAIHAKGSTIADSPQAVPVRRKGLRRTLLTPFLCSVLASIGMFGGISALFVGTMCVIFHSFFKQDVLFSQVGTVLLIVAIPMILLGSVFLDEIDQKK